MSAETYPKSFSEARALRGATQEEIADFVGLTRAAVGHWETGIATPPGPARRMLVIFFDYPLDVVDAWFSRAEEIAS